MAVTANHSDNDRPSQGKAHAEAGGTAASPALDEKPFRLAKSFSLIAIILIFAAVLTLATVVSRQAEIIITKRVEDDTIKLMENLNHQMYENFLRKVSDPYGRSRLREPAQQVLLHEVITNTIYGFDLKRVIIYDPGGETVYATDDTPLVSPAEDPLAFQEAIDRHNATPRIRFTLPRVVPPLQEPWAGDPGWLGERAGTEKSPLAVIPPETISPEVIAPEMDHLSPINPGVLPLPTPEPFRSGAGQPASGEPPAPEAIPLKPKPGEQAPLLDPNRSAPRYDSGPSQLHLTVVKPQGLPRTMTGPEENYLEYQRSQTVFRYEGGGYLLFNFLPRGDFVLRSYKALEDYSSNQGLSGVLAVDRDLTPEYRQIARLQYFALGVAAFLALVLTMVLRGVVSRGEAILTKRNLERQALRERLDQAERLAGLGSMVATVAHEIRNPLGIIHSTADVLNRFLSTNPDQARLARAIVEEADRLSEVVTEFLDFARPPVPNLAPVVVEDILEEILAFLEVTLARAGVEVRTSFRQDPVPISGDSSMLHRVFLNVLINAIQAMDDGGLITVATRLELAPRRGEPRLLVAISDTGPGLSEETAKKLFNPFYTTKAKGTGLGLVIVRNIVESHGGEIELVNGPPRRDSGDGAGPGLTALIYLKI